jgi:hypothetical protein
MCNKHPHHWSYPISSCTPFPYASTLISSFTPYTSTLSTVSSKRKAAKHVQQARSLLTTPHLIINILSLYRNTLSCFLKKEGGEADLPKLTPKKLLGRSSVRNVATLRKPKLQT